MKALSTRQAEKFNAPLAADKKDQIMGVKMGQIFALAKEFMGMELDEVEKLLDHPAHEARVGAVSIMDFQARSKKTTPERKKELFDLYIRRHDRINTWDLVDRSAIWVVGSYLLDKPRKILYKLAKSKMMAERRTAIVSTLFFIGKHDLDDTYKLAEMMLYDKEELIHKANGWALRYAGDMDKKRLLKFLDQYAATMPRVTLRYTLEKMDKKTKEHYMGLGKSKA
ncbi:MAG: DNA alkylation repair protein [Anaerolineales bacterium]